MDVMFGWTHKARVAPREMVDRSGAYDGVRSFLGHGLIAGTLVASELGWRPVEALAVGDRVATFDNGLQTIVDVRRTQLCLDALPGDQRPVTVPVGALGNQRVTRLLPEQGIVVESDAAQDAFGDPFALVEAAVLDGFRNIYRTHAAEDLQIVTIFFANSEVIYVDGGLLAYCPTAYLAMSDMGNARRQPYDLLDPTEANFLVECMEYEDRAAGHFPVDAPAAAYIYAA